MGRWSDYSETYRENYSANPSLKLQKNLKWKEENPHKFLYNSCKQRAKKLGIPFEVSPEEIIVPEVCPVLKQPLVFATRHSPSVDRIDNSKGYVKGNIVVISQLANKMKNCATEEELRLFCENIQRVLNSNNMKVRPEMDDRWRN